MTIDCKNCPLRSKPVFSPMTDSEVEFMRDFKSGETHVEAGTTLLMQGTSSAQLFTVLDGMGLRYKTLPDGRRQVLNFLMPGDFLGLQSTVLAEMRHSCEASTDMRLCVFKRDELWSLFSNEPRRAYDLTWLSAMEEHFLGESLTTVGQLSALERVARGFIKIYDRSEAVGLTQGDAAPMPYTQQDFADALGLSLVHTNKTLKKIRERQIASWRGGWLRIADLETLRELAAFEIRERELERPLI